MRGGLGTAFAKPIQAQHAIWIDHDLDNQWIGERFRDI